jgi:hypothetical protein
MPLPYHSYPSNHINIWRRTQITMLLITPPPHPFSVSSSFLSNYSAQHSAPKRNPITHIQKRDCAFCRLLRGQNATLPVTMATTSWRFYGNNPSMGATATLVTEIQNQVVATAARLVHYPSYSYAKLNCVDRKRRNERMGLGGDAWIILALVRSQLP